MLDYFGHNKASILNGGIQKWTADGHKLTQDEVKVERARFTPTVRERHRQRRLAPGAARRPWRGGDRGASAGLVPEGPYSVARSIPWVLNPKPDNTMKTADDLLAHFAAHGVRHDKNIASHCQDGKASAHTYFTLRLLGFPRVKSYDRSWAEWGAADDLPKTVPESRG